MTIILAPDSFKGTLTALQAARAMEEGLSQALPGVELAVVPVADGGEGTVDCFLRALGCRSVTRAVTGPFYGELVPASYALDGERAVIEMAACAGLPLAEGRLRPLEATTWGVGELIRDAVCRGARRIVLGLGGSATNDCGVGMAMALGARFYDREGRLFRPSAGTLDQVGSYDLAPLRTLLRGVTVTAMCDITNPLWGPRGAARVFGPQKGADEEMVALLERNHRSLAETIRRESGLEVQSLPGAGAAGGLGAGVAAFLEGALSPGIDTVLELVGFDRLLDRADLVLTGEGRLDSQSLGGKVVSGIARRAKEKGVPTVALAGAIGEDLDWAEAHRQGLTAAFSINPAPVDFSIARRRSYENLRETARSVGLLFGAGRRIVREA